MGSYTSTAIYIIQWYNPTRPTYGTSFLKLIVLNPDYAIYLGLQKRRSERGIIKVAQWHHVLNSLHVDLLLLY